MDIACFAYEMMKAAVSGSSSRQVAAAVAPAILRTVAHLQSATSGSKDDFISDEVAALIDERNLFVQ
jgi:3-polyprenyl-4-hydroxybenzoate decarboxylase